jgi:hypothetical protein
MMKNKLLSVLMIIGTLFCSNSMFAESLLVDSTNNATGSLPDSVAQMVHANADAIEKINGLNSFHNLLLIVISVLLIVCLILVGLLTYSKIHSKGNSVLKSLRTDVNELRDDFFRFRQQSLTNDDLDRALVHMRNQLEALQSRVNQELTKPTASQKEANQSVFLEQAHVQYLKADKNDGFFFEGSDKNDGGCQFKVTFSSKHDGAKANLELITDLSNIKSIPVEFFRKAFKITGKSTIKEATRMKILSSGICQYDQKDSIWKISRPIEIQLFK